MCETGMVRPNGCERCGQACRGHGAAGLAAGGAQLRGRHAKDPAQDRQRGRQGRGQGRAQAWGRLVTARTGPLSEAAGGGEPGEAGAPAGAPSKAQLGKGLVQAGWGGGGPCRHPPPMQAQLGRCLVQGSGGGRGPCRHHPPQAQLGRCLVQGGGGQEANLASGS